VALRRHHVRTLLMMRTARPTSPGPVPSEWSPYPCKQEVRVQPVNADPYDGEGEAFAASLERAQVLGKQLGQHVEAPVD